MGPNSTQLDEVRKQSGKADQQVERELFQLYDRFYFHEAQKIRILREIKSIRRQKCNQRSRS